MIRTLSCLVGAVVVSQLVLSGGCQKHDPHESRQPAAKKSKRDFPNIILIYTDDIDCESVFTTWPEQPGDLIRFPNLQRLAKNGTTFTNFHVTTPVCGPSRACLLSGQYAHRTGVRVNTSNVHSANGFRGGYLEFNKEQELGFWMKNAGYRTAYVGKYLHDDFTPVEEKQQTWDDVLPRGWDHFIGSLGGQYQAFAQVRNKGGLKRITGEYRTDNESATVSDLIDRRFSGSDQPFFLCWAPYASHSTKEFDTMTAKRHVGMFEDQVPSGTLDAARYENLENQSAEMASIPLLPTQATGGWTKINRIRPDAIPVLDDD